MNADIVARLRILWTSCTDRINNERTEAADEIERLRAEVERLRAGGCARDQTTTQFCAEAERLRDRCNRLLHQLQEFEAREAQ